MIDLHSKEFQAAILNVRPEPSLRDKLLFWRTACACLALIVVALIFLMR